MHKGDKIEINIFIPSQKIVYVVIAEQYPIKPTTGHSKPEHRPSFCSLAELFTTNTDFLLLSRSHADGDLTRRRQGGYLCFYRGFYIITGAGAAALLSSESEPCDKLLKLLPLKHRHNYLGRGWQLGHRYKYYGGLWM